MNKILVGLLALGVAGAAVAQEQGHKGAQIQETTQVQETAPVQAAAPVEAAQPMDTAGAVQLAQVDADFGNKVASKGMMEVELGKLAQDKGVSQSIKDLGKMIFDDHSKANEKLTSILQKKSVALPSEMATEHRAILAKLQGLSGKEFDTEFKAAMIKGHQESITMFESHLTAGQDADIKAFAQEILPALKHHLKMAEDAVIQ